MPESQSNPLPQKPDSDASELSNGVSNSASVEVAIESSEPPQTAAKKPTGFKRVALLISKRTTDLIAIAIVGFGLFAVSGQLSDWWSTPAQPIDSQRTALEVAGQQTSWNDNRSPVKIQLGQLPVELQRATITGDLAAVESAVLPRLAKLIDETPASDRRIDSNIIVDKTTERMNSAERVLLSGIRSIKPIQTSKHGSIYRLDEPGSAGFSSTFVGSRNSEKGDTRIVAWAMAIPYGTTDWRVFWFRRISDKVRAASAFPLPADTVQVFSIGDINGDGLLSFRLNPNKEKTQRSDWQQFFSDRFSSGGWQPTRNWTQSAQRVAARFENPKTGVVAEITINNNDSSGVVNVMTRQPAE